MRVTALLYVDRVRDTEMSREFGNLHDSFESVGRDCDIHLTNSVHTDHCGHAPGSLILRGSWRCLENFDI